MRMSNLLQDTGDVTICSAIVDQKITAICSCRSLIFRVKVSKRFGVPAIGTYSDKSDADGDPSVPLGTSALAPMNRLFSLPMAEILNRFDTFTEFGQTAQNVILSFCCLVCLIAINNWCGISTALFATWS